MSTCTCLITLHLQKSHAGMIGHPMGRKNNFLRTFIWSTNHKAMQHSLLYGVQATKRAPRAPAMPKERFLLSIGFRTQREAAACSVLWSLKIKRHFIEEAAPWSKSASVIIFCFIKSSLQLQTGGQIPSHSHL